MLKKVLKVAANTLVTALLAVMLILVFVSVTSKFSGDGSSKIGSYKLMVVLSSSMSPLFNAGDVIIVSTNKRTQYNKGDVITFRSPEDPQKIITHRVVDTQASGNKLSYITKGDANNSNDFKPVPATNIIGQEKACIPYFGNVVEFTKTKVGVILLVVLPGLLIIASEFRNIIKTLAEAERKKREVEVHPWTKN